MYNVCNAGVTNRCGGGMTSYQSTNGGIGCSCGCWNGCWQRVCRDGCGNLLVRNVNNGYTNNTCGCCHYTCGCGTGNGAAVGNNGNTGTNGNGVFRCMTICGYGNGTAQNRSGCNCALSYYARQYGLTCDDGGDCAYNFTND